MTMIYTPADWYWSGAPGVYGSKRGALVAEPTTDVDYLAWQGEGARVATVWPSDESGAQTAAALDGVLTAAGQKVTGLTPPTQAQLLAYANGKQWSLATGGYTITVGGTALLFATDQVSQGLITGKAARFAQPNPPASVNWQFATGFVTIQAADFISAATEIADFVQSTFDALAPVMVAIVGGTITTDAQIDAAAWPSNVSSTPA